MQDQIEGETGQAGDVVDDVRGILQSAWLEVAGTRISVETPEKSTRDALDAIRTYFAKVPIDPAGDDPSHQALLDLRGALEAAARNASGSSISAGGGLLHKALHKSLHKSLHKGLHKSAFPGGGGGAGSGLDWPVIEVPWRELTRLYQCRDHYRWDRFRLSEMPPPPQVRQRLAETADLHQKQKDLREPENAFRRDRIRIEASNDLTAYMLPLGANASSPASATAILFQTILWLASLIGLLYKERFNAPRPHQLDPTLEPFIPVPVYSSYPSNHAFQSYLIAEVFARAVPEHPGVEALALAAGEVARNREWAGLHIKSDTEGGQTLARLCAPMFEEILQDQIREVRNEWLGGE
ncbi:phosphatase PAP2 family protein [Maliponia aquimaris]|uniref:PAP2 superfamily protein n=1 Tax=Maliponia aquimaris TaxID=1673631 RepID=A0A238KMQ1_9RHOB|nr:hypothetical protein [Maliponia aquimaris]SMX43927.1 PAP2 superfamily protein [Maliponia aquimaris]